MEDWPSICIWTLKYYKATCTSISYSTKSIMKLKNDIHSNLLVLTNIDVYGHYYRAKSASYKKYRKDQIWNKFTVLCWARLFYNFRIHLKQVHFLTKLLNSTVLIEFAFYSCFSFVQSKKALAKMFDDFHGTVSFPLLVYITFGKPHWKKLYESGSVDILQSQAWRPWRLP